MSGPQVSLDISELLPAFPAFPAFRVAPVVARGLAIAPERPQVAVAP